MRTVPVGEMGIRGWMGEEGVGTWRECFEPSRGIVESLNPILKRSREEYISTPQTICEMCQDIMTLADETSTHKVESAYGA